MDLTSSPTKTPPRKNGLVRPSGSPHPNFNPHLGAKRIVVKNFRKTPKTDPRQYFDLIWGKLDAALDVIFDDGKITFSLEELYRGVENVCRQGFAAELSEKLQNKSEKHVEEDVRDVLLRKVGNTNVDILRAVLATWATWKSQLVSISFCHFRSFYTERFEIKIAIAPVMQS